MSEQNGNNGATRKRILIGLGVVVLAAAAIYGAWWYEAGQYHEVTDDAYVNGNVVGISPRVSGTVVAINVDNTDLVHEGDVLVQLDDTDARVALDQAKANLAQTVREVRQLFDQARELTATVELRKATLTQAERDYRRAQDLKKVRGISTENLQHAETALATARAALNQATHQLATSRAATSDTTIETHPRVQQAKARLREAWLALQRTRIVSPATGYVAQRSVQLGEQVSPASKLMAVVPLNQVWVDANFKETDLTHVRIGQPVTLTADLYGSGHIFHGKVFGLAAGTGSAFALLPAQNATGNWIKVVQRVPVRIAVNPVDLAGYPLRIGLSMTVDVDCHDLSGAMLAQRPFKGARLATPAYKVNDAKIDDLIEKIIRANRGKVE